MMSRNWKRCSARSWSNVRLRRSDAISTCALMPDTPAPRHWSESKPMGTSRMSKVEARKRWNSGITRTSGPEGGWSKWRIAGSIASANSWCDTKSSNAASWRSIIWPPPSSRSEKSRLPLTLFTDNFLISQVPVCTRLRRHRLCQGLPSLCLSMAIRSRARARTLWSQAGTR